jgi:hypothetical protein
MSRHFLLATSGHILHTKLFRVSHVCISVRACRATGVAVSIFQNSMLDASSIHLEGGLVAGALSDKTSIAWMLDDPLLSFPRRGIRVCTVFGIASERACIFSAQSYVHLCALCMWV